MTTKELENKLKISEKTCIHCPTLELAKQVLSIFHHLGLKWDSGNSYIIRTGWDRHEENTVYYPVEGTYSSLEIAQLRGYKVINSEEFIALHTEGKEFDLENYEPKGDLIGFPKEIIARMLDCQVEQGNKEDVSVFERQCATGCFNKGFTWDKTKEGSYFWHNVINNKDFDFFFERRYPKKDNPQDFRINDKVYDILLKEVGVVQDIVYSSSFIPHGLLVEFKSGLKSYTINGCYLLNSKNPQLLHYQDDYNYNLIDFNNLPKRQETKRWRAEKNRIYYYVNFYTKDWFLPDETYDYYTPMDHDNYYSGNYFRTEIEAEIISQKLNTYLKQLIKEEHENEKERN
jgi:hypothetical protein